MDVSLSVHSVPRAKPPVVRNARASDSFLIFVKPGLVTKLGSPWQFPGSYYISTKIKSAFNFEAFIAISSFCLLSLSAVSAQHGIESALNRGLSPADSVHAVPCEAQ